MIKWLLRALGIVGALTLDYFIVLKDFILVDVHYTIKLAFGGMFVFFILTLIFYHELVGWLQRKRQAIATVKEMGQATQTSPVVINLLNFIGIALPVALLGGMFWGVSNFFNDLYEVMFKLLATLSIPLAAFTTGDIIEQNKLKEAALQKEDAFAGKVADKMTKRGAGYR